MSSPRTKSLIVCADDFGMSSGVNEGIIRAHQEGILTETSLMVGGAAFEDAVSLARNQPSLAVGLHLVLVQGRAVTAAQRIPALVGRDAMFSKNPVTSGLRYFFTPAIRQQLRCEIEAQLEKFRATGLPLSHIDGHLNIHMHPTVLRIIVELAELHSIQAVRLTSEPLRPALRFDRRDIIRKTAEATVFNLLARHAKKRLSRHRIRYTDATYGLHQSGRLSEAYLLELLPLIRPGLTEIYCHAGFCDAESRRWRPCWYDPEAEMAAILSATVRTKIEDLGIRLTNYRDLD